MDKYQLRALCTLLNEQLFELRYPKNQFLLDEFTLQNMLLECAAMEEFEGRMLMKLFGVDRHHGPLVQDVQHTLSEFLLYSTRLKNIIRCFDFSDLGYRPSAFNERQSDLDA